MEENEKAGGWVVRWSWVGLGPDTIFYERLTLLMTIIVDAYLVPAVTCSSTMVVGLVGLLLGRA